MVISKIQKPNYCYLTKICSFLRSKFTRSARKTPPSKPTLTQMSRDEDKRRKMDYVLLTSISNYHNRQPLSVRMHFRSFSRSAPISASHAIGGVHLSSDDSQYSGEDFLSNRVYRVQYKKRSDKKRENTQRRRG